jgi:DNA replication licensing factor MCM7
VTSRSFMPVPKCIGEQCVSNQTEGKVRMVTRGCKFQKYQEIKIQELPEQVPIGHIPRTMTVIARGEVVRRVVPGDIVTIGGVFLPTPYTGFQAMKAGLTTDTFLEAHAVTKAKKQESSITPEMQAIITELANDDAVYDKLSRSIAPEIFGHENVKKALLLQLVGGVSRKQKDGMRTRGDLHICLMGDPGVAKSQLLKHIAKLAPRCVYTTGKGSSGVGLTAAVLRDPLTQELTLEGGALVLADMGICCIDEFDKMEEGDRTAIHEVMEQQTVSIAKAGITTMLNARTAVLAAANPRYGRYNRYADRDPHVALLKNINLPAALLSRFDLMFLLLDEVDSENDRALAEHVTYVHQQERHPPLAFDPIEPAVIRQYVAVAKHVSRGRVGGLGGGGGVGGVGGGGGGGGGARCVCVCV